MTLATLPLPILDRVPSGAAGPLPAPGGALRDPLGRGIGYLRLSLTRACSMRCTYCRPAKLLNPRDEVRLSPDEIEAVVRHLADTHGLSKVRLTGGDPTSRPELVEIIRRIASIPEINDLAMTTNGLTLAAQATRYRDAGLNRINISLDTLDRQRFAELTGVDGLTRVLRGIDAARAAGLSPIKLNCVVVRGQNDADLPALLRFAAQQRLSLRLIELMPMGPLADVWAQRYVPEQAMRQILSGVITRYEPIEQGHDAARRYRVTLDDGSTAELGFITPMSCNFCADCNRLRLAADGTVYPCLMDKPAGSILDAVRPGLDAERFDAALRRAYAGKQPEHPATGHAVMTNLGG